MSLDQIALLSELYPLRRDIISEGYDQALELLAHHAPFKVHRFESGSRCWSWRVPEKWTCDEAYVETLDGRRIIDQADHYLHVASYSTSIDQVVSREELLAHLHTHPYLDDQPPFTFYYYQKNWGFGCGKSTLESLVDDAYRVVIRSRFEPGHLKVAEYVLPGESDELFVFSTHLCHPGQVNDGLSGVVTALAIMEELATWQKRRYTYLMLVVPETIGTVAWLSQHEDLIPKMKGGLFMEMTGLSQPPALQLSYFEDTQLDKCFKHVHLAREKEAWVAPYRGVVGNDERQFNAPGVRVPMLSYARAFPWGHPHRPYKEYHSPKDNLEITSAEQLETSKNTILEMIRTWEGNYFPENLFKGEVFLSGFDLAVDRNRYLDLHRNMLKIMDCIDGTNSIIDIADKLKICFSDVKYFVDNLVAVGLVSPRDASL